MERVKFGVIGLGWFGEKHCEVLSDLPQAQLFALCTRTESRLQEVSQRFKVPHAYVDYNELLANPEVDAVCVVTMWDQHVGPALAALRAGNTFLSRSRWLPRFRTVRRSFRRRMSPRGAAWLATYVGSTLAMQRPREKLTPEQSGKSYLSMHDATFQRQ